MVILSSSFPSTVGAPLSLRRPFEIPAKSSRSTLDSRASPAKASRCRLAATDDESDGSVWNRRGVLFTAATFPFLFPLGDSIVKAAESGEKSEYEIIKEEIRKAVPKGRAAGVLRLVFHDAGTFEVNDKSGGMNGSVIYELKRFENTGLTGPVKILEKAKKGVEAIQPVSWADMIAVAGAEAVSICGGPTIPVVLGRLDSTEPDPEGKLPEETQGALSMKQSFLRKGFSAQELVALSGAHTLGSKGFGDSDTFDNSYFKILLGKPWKAGGMTGMVGLPSDRAIADDEECLRWITKYAQNQELFFEDFSKAYIKLVNSGAKWKSA